MHAHADSVYFCSLKSSDDIWSVVVDVDVDLLFLWKGLIAVDGRIACCEAELYVLRAML